MFNADFWPTPPAVAAQMIDALDVKGMKILEPSAGMGNLVIALKAAGAAEVIACEKEQRLRYVLEHECRVIAEDFFTVTSAEISHVDAIVMNPPFTSASSHILHAWKIAPDGCIVVALCNTETLNNRYSTAREEFSQVVKSYGYAVDLGNCFSKADRPTDVSVSMIWMKKPCQNQDAEFEGFFMDEEPEGQAEEGIMKYDAIRDIVNRYVAAVKLYEKQIVLGDDMRSLTELFPVYHDARGKEDELHYLTCDKKNSERYRADFKKGLQKRAWKFIFDKLDMQKHSTRSLKEDLNKFVEHQVNIPFTMQNIYRMLEIVVGTTGSRMDKALIEVFDKLTMHYDENRYSVEGWKTNSHYLVNQKFILNYLVEVGYSGQIEFKYYKNGELVEDMAKALCYMTGTPYEGSVTLADKIRGEETGTGYRKEYINKPEWGQWFDWGFFECKCYKKGTMHFKFKDVKVWEMFNYNIARIKGYPLFEGNSKREEFKNSFHKEKAA